MTEAEPFANRPAPAKPVPGIAQSLAVSALFFGISMTVTSALQLLHQSAGVSLDFFSSHLVQEVIAWPLALWVGLRWNRASFREVCPLTRFPVHIVPALLIASFGVTILLLAASMLIPGPKDMALPFGLSFAWLFLRTGSLVPGILSHITANFSTNFLLLPIALTLGYDAQALKRLGYFPLSLLAIGGATAGLGGVILWRQLNDAAKSSSEPSGAQ